MCRSEAESTYDIGINDNRFLFVLQVVVRNLRDEGRAEGYILHAIYACHQLES